MITLDQLSQEIWPLATKGKVGTETLSIEQALNRVLSDDVVSPINVPQFDNSAMDGYAVRCGDFAQQRVFRVSQRIAAGDNPPALSTGSVARIFTGAPVPAGCDAIIMQEEATVDASTGEVAFSSLPTPEQWIRRAGDDIAERSVVLEAGTRLGAVDIGLLASIGVSHVKVSRQLKIGLLITGSELQRPGEPLKPGHIYNSNEYVWRALVEQLGAKVECSGIVEDNREKTIEAMRVLAESCDIVLSSGGVSVGEEDHVKPAVEVLGELKSWKVSMKPGKPVAFGALNKKDGSRAWFFGLPGNPVSSAVTFLLLVKPFMDLMCGRKLEQSDWRGNMASYPMKDAWIKPDVRREEFLRGTLKNGEISLFANQSSGVLTSMSRSNGLIRVPVGGVLAPADMASFISYSDLLS